MGKGVVGVLLAAGYGTRFGADKLMHRLPTGAPLALAAAAHLKPACDHLVVVIRPEHVVLGDALAALDCEVVTCAEAGRGMGFSLATGVKASPDAHGWIVALADMPFVRTSSHALVADAIRSGASLAATEYCGKRGHPVGFSSAWFSQLAQLSGDEGARRILSRHPHLVTLRAVDDAGVLCDIDRRGDLPIA